MIVLGLDTATSATAVALRVDERHRGEARDDPAPGEHPGHATRLLGMADALLRDAEVAWSEIERIAVGIGPGTFTGLRVGVATARGLAQSLGIGLVGVSSLQALAMPALGKRPGSELPAGVVAVIDARRGQVFAAGYARSADREGAPRQLTSPAPGGPGRSPRASPRGRPRAGRRTGSRSGAARSGTAPNWPARERSRPMTRPFTA